MKCSICRSRTERSHQCIYCGNRYDTVDEVVAHQRDRQHFGGHGVDLGPIARAEPKSYVALVDGGSEVVERDRNAFEPTDDGDAATAAEDADEQRGEFRARLLGGWLVRCGSTSLCTENTVSTRVLQN
jgi:hypothetical protein